jgi:hypothetical protein
VRLMLDARTYETIKVQGHRVSGRTAVDVAASAAVCVF